MHRSPTSRTPRRLRRFSTNRSGNDNIPLIYLGNSGAFPNSANPGNTASTIALRQRFLDQDAAIVRQRGYDRHNNVEGNSSSENFSAFVNAGTRLNDKIDFYLT